MPPLAEDDVHSSLRPAISAGLPAGRAGDPSVPPGSCGVLYVVTHGEMGGVHRYLDAVLSCHSSRYRPVVLSFADGRWLDALRARQLKVYVAPDLRLRQPARAYRIIRAILRRENIRLVHSSYAWCHALVASAAWRGACRTIWYHHGPMSDRRWQGWLPLLPADLLLTNSEFMLARLRRSWRGARQLGIAPYGLDVARFAPDPEKRRQFRRHYALEELDLAVGIAAFLDDWKGQDVVLQAAKLLGESLPRLRFFIVGGPRHGRDAARCLAFQASLHDYARRERLLQRVVFTGHLEPLDGALDGLDIFLHASVEPEPFGMALLEAMAKGQPIIASRGGGPSEIFTDGLDGRLIPPRDAPALAAAIRTLAERPEERRRLAGAARQTVAARFGALQAARRLEAWYDRLLASGVSRAMHP